MAAGALNARRGRDGDADSAAVADRLSSGRGDLRSRARCTVAGIGRPAWGTVCNRGCLARTDRVNRRRNRGVQAVGVLRLLRLVRDSGIRAAGSDRLGKERGRFR